MKTPRLPSITIDPKHIPALLALIAAILAAILLTCIVGVALIYRYRPVTAYDFMNDDMQSQTERAMSMPRVAIPGTVTTTHEQ